MGWYHPSQDDLDVCITAAATKKTFAKSTVTNLLLRPWHYLREEVVQPVLIVHSFQQHSVEPGLALD
jgi:hypothetical protein